MPKTVSLDARTRAGKGRRRLTQLEGFQTASSEEGTADGKEAGVAVRLEEGAFVQGRMEDVLDAPAIPNQITRNEPRQPRTHSVTALRHPRPLRPRDPDHSVARSSDSPNIAVRVPKGRELFPHSPHLTPFPLPSEVDYAVRCEGGGLEDCGGGEEGAGEDEVALGFVGGELGGG